MNLRLPPPPGASLVPAPPQLPTLQDLASVRDVSPDRSQTPQVPGLEDLQRRVRSIGAQGALAGAQAAQPSSPAPFSFPFSPTGGQTAPFSVMPSAPANFGGYEGGAQVADNTALASGIKPGSLKGAPGVVKLAATQLGTPYVFGAENPGGSFDCSGLTKWAYSRMGVDLPHSAEGQMQTTTPVSAQQLKPGMLVYFNFGRLAPGVADHVMIYAGNGRAIGAQPSTGGVGWYDNIFSMPEVIGYGAVPGVNYSSAPRRTSPSSPQSQSHPSSPSPSPSPRPSSNRAPTQRQAISQKQMSGVGRRL